MIFTLPQYECKHNGKGKWKDVSESDLLRDLNEFYGRVTPDIKQIIKGKYFRLQKLFIV